MTKTRVTQVIIGLAVMAAIGALFLPKVIWDGMAAVDLQVEVRDQDTGIGVGGAEVGYYLQRPEVPTLGEAILPAGYGWRARTDRDGKCQLRAIGGAGGTNHVFWKTGRVGPAGYLVAVCEAHIPQLVSVPELLERSSGTRMVPLGSKPAVEIALQPRVSDRATTVPSADGPSQVGTNEPAH